jgi:hypothetical protein
VAVPVGRVAAAASVSVRCPGCGTHRILSRRQARRAGLCLLCRSRPETPTATDDDLRWWLRRFTDAEIVALAADFAGRETSPSSLEAVRRQRHRLLTALDPDEGLRGGPCDVKPDEPDGRLGRLARAS